jgi:CubicO group peptidase (beta-lactamase class C family)
LPLNLSRQFVAIAAAPVPVPNYDPALAPVTAADLQSVLDRDLAEALKSGELAPGTGAGVSIAVVEHGVRRVFSYGAAKQDSIFEIGSITKTFTGLVLSQMVEQGKVKFDEPVRELLPPGNGCHARRRRDNAARSGHAAFRSSAHTGQLQARRSKQSLC